MNTTHLVRQFMTENFYIADTDSFTDDTPFLEHGIVDSTGILEVVEFLERTFDMQLEDADLTPENLNSVASIVAFVDRKRRAA